MRKEIIQTGNTVEEAINSACVLIGYPREDCEYDIIDLPKSSFFGLKKTPAKVKVWIDLPDEEPIIKEKSKEKTTSIPVAQKPQVPVKAVEKKAGKPAPQAAEKVKAPQKVNSTPKPPQELKEKADVDKAISKEAPVLQIDTNLGGQKAAGPAIVIDMDIILMDNDVVRGTNPEDVAKAEVSKEYISHILHTMDISDFELSYKWENGGAYLAVYGNNLGAIIGRRGDTLDALQYLTGLVANRMEGEYLRVTVDCGDYRRKRNVSLIEMAQKAAEHVLHTDISKVLEPMNAAERRIVHATISQMPGIESSSIGADPFRKVVIKTPTSKMKSSGGRRPSGRDNRNDRNSRGGGRKPSSSGRGRDRDRDRKPPVEAKVAPEEIGSISPEKAGDTPLYGKVEL